MEIGAANMGSKINIHWEYHTDVCMCVCLQKVNKIRMGFGYMLSFFFLSLSFLAQFSRHFASVCVRSLFLVSICLNIPFDPQPYGELQRPFLCI